MILFASDWADPAPRGSNRLVAAQAQGLRALGADVRILTWPREGVWTGPLPTADSTCTAGAPSLEVERGGIPYTVVSLPPGFADRFPTEDEWEARVAAGEALLRALRPELLHVFFWQSHWWLLDAAQRLGIRTVYTACDYGLLCSRTLLVTGSGAPCDGPKGVLGCSACVLRGRGPVGLANELAAQLPFARPLLNRTFADGTGPLARRGGVRLPVQERVGGLLRRSQRVLSRLDALVVTSPFAASLFERSVRLPRQRIHVLPWFTEHEGGRAPLPSSTEPLRVGMVTRLSPEKGVDLLLAAAARTATRRPLELHLAGTGAGRWADELRARYAERAGAHAVHWAGWLSGADVTRFTQRLHVVAVPSRWPDNTPLAMVEALALGRPVVCTDLPSMTHLVKNGVNGLTFPFEDAAVLSKALERLADEEGLVQRLSDAIGRMPTVREHCGALRAIHETVLS